MPNVAKYKLKEMAGILHEARTCSTLENADFAAFAKDRLCAGKYPTCEEEVNDFIKRRVRTHHSSWITGQIDRVLHDLNGFLGERNAQD